MIKIFLAFILIVVQFLRSRMILKNAIIICQRNKIKPVIVFKTDSQIVVVW